MLNKKKLLAEPKLLGRWGQKQSEKFLRRKGFKTIERNFLCKTGEIDLIMTRVGKSDGQLVFVEVKTRANEDFSDAESAITGAKQVRMSRAAKYFIQMNNVKDVPMRFDVVIVVLTDKSSPEIRHYENAFSLK